MRASLPALYILLLLAAVPLGGCQLIYNHLGGAWTGLPHEMEAQISPEARTLIDKAFADIGEDEVLVDYHVHMISHEVNRRWRNPFWHPFRYGRTMVYLSGAGLRKQSPTLDEDHINRMLSQVEHFPREIRLFLYAMDYSYYADGSVDLDNTNIYVSNHAVFEWSQRHPDVFVPVVSVHPYRPDAIAKLHYWADRGVRHVKWIPNSMGINPVAPRLDVFYQAMAERDMVLLSHTGEEGALEEVDRDLGNPLLLRRALDHGVKVVALHFASDGYYRDYENPRRLRYRPGYELLLRMLENPDYEGLLYVDTAAVIFFNHLSEPLEALLDRPDLHHRFINGSDYPLSALNITIWLGVLRSSGFLDREHIRPLEEIYDYNPMLYEFVLKRLIRHPETGERMAKQMFLLHDDLP